MISGVSSAVEPSCPRRSSPLAFGSPADERLRALVQGQLCRAAVLDRELDADAVGDIG